jgi:hypothetical protein
MMLIDLTLQAKTYRHYKCLYHLKLPTRPGFAQVQRTKVFLYYITHVIHMNLTLEPHYLLKKPHQNPLGSFKDLSIHRYTVKFDYI